MRIIEKIDVWSKCFDNSEMTNSIRHDKQIKLIEKNWFSNSSRSILMSVSRIKWYKMKTSNNRKLQTKKFLIKQTMNFLCIVLFFSWLIQQNVRFVSLQTWNFQNRYSNIEIDDDSITTSFVAMYNVILFFDFFYFKFSFFHLFRSRSTTTELISVIKIDFEFVKWRVVERKAIWT